MGLILVLNSGSSSHKCSLFDTATSSNIWYAHLTWREEYKQAKLKIDSTGIEKKIKMSSSKEGLLHIFDALPSKKLVAIGHRVVHGGEVFIAPTQINQRVIQKIRKLCYLAPLHNPVNLQGIEITRSLFPNLRQFAVFDTAFHTTLSPVVATYPLSLKWKKKGIRKYGFHGISHAYCSQRATKLIGEKKKIVIAHLGAGASLCGVDQGCSIDTTMGMTPLEGLMMASRCGSIDPGVLLHLINYEGLPIKKIDQMLNQESGLLGISGSSGDMRIIEKKAQTGDVNAQLALDMYLHRLNGHIGMMIASLKGIDALIFTAGIGENSSYIRQKCIEHWSFLGMKLDKRKNRAFSSKERQISTKDSQITVWVIPTKEEWQIGALIKDHIS